LLVAAFHELDQLDRAVPAEKHDADGSGDRMQQGETRDRDRDKDPERDNAEWCERLSGWGGRGLPAGGTGDY
jgi:hypothetical protein